MKTFLLSLFIGAFCVSANAQTPLTQAVDFDVTFTDGTEFNLFDKLAEGKWVCIDWFFTTCGPCQANQAFYSETYVNFGSNQGEIFFLSVETTVGDPETIAYEETYGGPSHPPAASGTDGGGIDAEDPYSIGAYPTFILIDPDGNIVEQDMWPLTNGADTFTSYFAGHGLQPTGTSIEEAVSASVSSYPNPAQDIINLELSGFNGIVNIEVYDLVGTLVYSAQTRGIRENINVAEWAAGNYLLNVYTENDSYKEQISVIR